MIEIFCGIEFNNVLKVSKSDQDDLVQSLSKILSEQPKLKTTFKINNVEFGFIPSLEDILLEEYVDLEENLKDVDTLHKAMAVMYRPITKKQGNQYEIEPYISTINYCDVMKFAPLDVVFSSMVFFWNLNNELLLAMPNYLENQTKQLTSLAQDINSKNHGVGILQSISWLKEILPSSMK